MADERNSLEVKMEQLSTEVSLLRQRVDQLAAQVAASGGVTLADTVTPSVVPASARPVEAELSPQPSFEGFSSRILSQASTASFLMVIALILRTVTDFGLINKQLGAYVGIGYAAVLLGIGWYRYQKESPQAPVFTLCSTMLMFLVVGETNLNTKFNLLPLLPAHILLILTGAVTAGATNRFRVRLPFSIGTVGMAVTAVVLTFHEVNPDFRFLIVTVLAANLLGHFTVRLEGCSWVRWSLFGITIYAAIWWAYRIVLPYLSDPSGKAAAQQQLPWFLAGVGIFGFTYLVIAAWEIIAGRSEKVGAYYLAIPTLTVLWSFGAVQYLTTVLESCNYLINLLGLAVSAFHIAVVWFLARKRSYGRGGLGAICNAGALLLALSLPTVAGSALYALPILSVAAYILIIFSGIWQSGGARLSSYLLQFHTSVYLTYVLATKKGADPVVSLAACLAIAVLAYLHYRWARGNTVPRDIRFFERYDRKDLSAALLLILALISGYHLLSGLTSYLFAGGNGRGAIAMVTGLQSIIINGTAAGLVIWGYLGRDLEKRNIAIIIILIGGFKVFFHDLVAAEGLAKVGSVLSFGIATAVLSVVMSRWQKRLNPVN
jgi:hypothetical protein